MCRSFQSQSGLPEIAGAPPQPVLLSHPLCGQREIAGCFTSTNRSRCSCPTCSPTLGYQVFPRRSLQHKHSSAITL